MNTFIGQLPSLRLTQAFTDYLKVIGTAFKVEEIQVDVASSEAPTFTSPPEPKTFYAIYVNEADSSQTTELFDSFISNPTQDKFINASWFVTDPTSVSNNYATPNLGLMKIWQSVGPLTRYTALLCIAIFAASYFGWAREIFTSLKFEWTTTEVYRTITPAVMHLSAVHLIFNLAWWWYLGGNIEKVLGYRMLAIIFILSAIFSNTAQALIVDTGFAGLSGVNYALASFSWVCGYIHKSEKVQLPHSLFGFLIVWMVLGFVDVLPVSMANWAHFGGLIAGIILALLLVKSEDKKRAS